MNNFDSEMKHIQPNETYVKIEQICQEILDFHKMQFLWEISNFQFACPDCREISNFHLMSCKNMRISKIKKSLNRVAVSKQCFKLFVK